MCAYQYRPAGESDEDDSDFEFGDSPQRPRNLYVSVTPEDTISIRLEDAIKNQSMEKLNEIVERVKDLSTITVPYFNAVTYAAHIGNSEILKLTMEHYSLEKIQDSFTPLMGACKVPFIDDKDTVERIKCIQLLLDAKIDVDFKDRHGISALMIASSLGRTDLVEFLLKNEADVNLSDNDGWSALFYAVNDRHLDTARVLLKFNANVKKVDKRNRKAYDIAFQKNYIEIAELVKPVDDTALEQPPSEQNESIESRRHELLEFSDFKFYRDVEDIVLASSKGMERYSKMIRSRDVSLRDFLTFNTEDKLKTAGITFSMHRYELLNRIRQFHLCDWSPVSFGLEKDEENAMQFYSLLDVSNFMATLFRQMYSLRSTFLYINNDIVSSSEKEKMLAILKNIREQFVLINEQLTKMKRIAGELSIRTQPYLYAQKLID